MIKNTFNQMKENFGCNWTTEEQNLRIEMIKKGSNPYFVKELETGYVVIGDNGKL